MHKTSVTIFWGSSMGIGSMACSLIGRQLVNQPLCNCFCKCISPLYPVKGHSYQIYALQYGIQGLFFCSSPNMPPASQYAKMYMGSTQSPRPFHFRITLLALHLRVHKGHLWQQVFFSHNKHTVCACTGLLSTVSQIVFSRTNIQHDEMCMIWSLLEVSNRCVSQYLL